MNIEKIKKVLRNFSKNRDWDQFHSPKNLVMALAVESGELVEIFQWLTEEDSKLDNLNIDDLGRIREEIADILIYLIRIADKLDIDLDEAVKNKITLNEKKYPIKLSKGNSTKYNRRNT